MLSSLIGSRFKVDLLKLIYVIGARGLRHKFIIRVNTNLTNCTNMIIDEHILDSLTELAKANPRLRHSMDLRNSADDQSQRMLNALEPGTVMPIHRHKDSSETCICIRGHFEEYFYDKQGNLTDTIDMVPGGIVLNIEKGQWHSLKCLESGTVLLEAKDGPYEPLQDCYVLSVQP